MKHKARCLVLGGLLFGMGLPLRAHAQSTSTTISVTILPGPFSAQLVPDGGLVDLVVIDARGSGAGWAVQLDCTCTMWPVGPLQVGYTSSPISARHGPNWLGTTLTTGPGGYGMGTYTQAFVNVLGATWTVTTLLQEGK